jgi:hypothetical protein
MLDANLIDKPQPTSTMVGSFHQLCTRCLSILNPIARYVLSNLFASLCESFEGCLDFVDGLIKSTIGIWDSDDLKQVLFFLC